MGGGKFFTSSDKGNQFIYNNITDSGGNVENVLHYSYLRLYTIDNKIVLTLKIKNHEKSSKNFFDGFVILRHIWN